jgi:soluble P-type ATPase
LSAAIPRNPQEPCPMPILVPQPGDFDAWKKTHDAVVAVDWDGTCKDTMVAKWTKGFNFAITRVWPALAPHQKKIDEVCYQQNLAPGAVSANRFLMLRKMMGMWKQAGLTTTDLSKFSKALDHVQQAGLSHSTATYRKLQGQFGYDDAPLRWSDLSDDLIAEAVKSVHVFPHVREVLEGVMDRADLVVVSASKGEAVRQDIVDDKMEGLFKAMLAQDFLPKKQCLLGLKKKYAKVLFVADGAGDRTTAGEAGVGFFEVRIGDEAASWLEAKGVLEKFVNGR